MGLLLKIVSEFYRLIILKLAFFILPIYCTLWIIATACFSRLELLKINLLSQYFMNFSFTFLFIVTSTITMVTLLLSLLFLLLLLVLFSFVMCRLFLLSLFVVVSMSFIYDSVTMVCVPLLGFFMVMYMCMFICMCAYVYVCIYKYIYIYIYTYILNKTTHFQSSQIFRLFYITFYSVCE